jgi:4-amino-4-deoxychorismate lyase
MDNPPLLIESICIIGGKIQLLQYHNRRANLARSALYDCHNLIDFSNIIDIKEANHTITKCRIVYGESIVKVEYIPYALRPIDSLKIIEIDENYGYKHKYLNRTKLDHYFSKKDEADDILMIQSGLVTDSYYCNVAFSKNGRWYTPKKPLLHGTKRASLINTQQIIEKEIHSKEIYGYESVRLFNAMIAFGDIELSTCSIS